MMKITGFLLIAALSTVAHASTTLCDGLLSTPEALLRAYATLLSKTSVGLVSSQELRQMLEQRHYFTLSRQGSSERLAIQHGLSSIEKALENFCANPSQLHARVREILVKVIEQRAESKEQAQAQQRRHAKVGVGMQKIGPAHAMWPQSFSPDGTQVLLERFWEYRLVDTKTHHELWKRQIDGGKGINSIAWSPDGEFIAIGLKNDPKPMVMRSRPSTWPVILRYRGHSEYLSKIEIRRVEFSRDGRYMVSVGTDKTVRVWDPYTTKLSHIFDADAKAIGLSRDNRILIATEAEARIYDLVSGNHMVDLQLEGPCKIPEKFQFLGNESQHIIGTTQSHVALWDTESGKILHQFVDPDRPTDTFVVSGDEKYVLTTSTDGIVDVWDLNNGQWLRKIENNSWAAAVQVTPDSKIAILGGQDGYVRFFDLDTGQLIHTDEIRVNGHVDTLLLPRDGKKLYVHGFYEDQLKQYDLNEVLGGVLQ